jgi:hypothetical protein
METDRALAVGELRAAQECLSDGRQILIVDLALVVRIESWRIGMPDINASALAQRAGGTVDDTEIDPQRGTPLRPSARGQVGDRDNKGPSIDCGIWRATVILRLPKPEPVVCSLREMLVERVSHIGAVMVLFVSSGEVHLRPSARRSARAVFYALQFFFPNLSYSRRFSPKESA